MTAWSFFILLAARLILAATFLTLLFVPALYAAWFRVRRPASSTNISESFNLREDRP